MSKILVLLSSFIFISSSNCKQFHEGTFVFHDFGKEFKIVRKGGKQTEYVTGEKEVFEYDVEWDSDCSYKLFNARTVKGDIDISAYDIDTLRCKIIDVKGNTFRVICSHNGLDSTTPVITKEKQ